MIELPETNVLSNQLNNTIIGKTIKNAIANASPHGFAWFSCPPEEYKKRLAGKTITGSFPSINYGCGTDVEITADDMLLTINTPIRYHETEKTLPKKHQLLIEFKNQTYLSCTVQLWGAMNCFNNNESENLKKQLENSHPTPYSIEFDERHFCSNQRQSLIN